MVGHRLGEFSADASLQEPRRTHRQGGQVIPITRCFSSTDMISRLLNRSPSALCSSAAVIVCGGVQAQHGF